MSLSLLAHAATVATSHFETLTKAANAAASAQQRATDSLLRQQRLMDSVLAGPAGGALRQYIEIVHLQATGKFNGRDAFDLADAARKLEQYIRLTGGKDAGSIDFGAMRNEAKTGTTQPTAQSLRTKRLRGLL